MLKFYAFDLRAGERRDPGAERPIRDGRHLLRERVGDDNEVRLVLVDPVDEIWMKREREVRWNRPGRRRPDERRHFAAGDRWYPRREVSAITDREWKLDIDRR